MFDILENDDGDYEVFYSGTLVETFYSRTDAEYHISIVIREMNLASNAYTFDEPWMVA